MAAQPNAHPLRAQYPFRMRLADDRYAATEVIAPGGGFFDILLGWTDETGAVVFNDIGGQAQPGFNPDEGHGSVWRYGRDGSLTPIVPPGNMGQYAAIHIMRGRASFTGADDIFIVAQGGGGRANASAPHVVLRVTPGSNHPQVFATIPHAGTIGGGVAGAMMPDFIGLPGTPYEGQMFVHSMMNCTIYGVGPQGGEAEVFINFDRGSDSIMPGAVRQAPDWWGEHSGAMVFEGARSASFEGGVPGKRQRDRWIVGADRSYRTVDDVTVPLLAQRAPPEFGPYAGQLFWGDDGPVDLSHVAGCDMYAEGLPYSGRILRQSPDGEVHVFADDFYGSFTSIAFDRDRLIMGLPGRSYSTGEYHEPDASLYEIRLKPET